MLDRFFLTVWLIVVWVLLWGSLSPMVLLSAVVVAPLCLAACRLPALSVVARPRWRHVLGALGSFVLDLVVSSAQVAWTTVRKGPRTRSAVVAVPVGSASDVAMTVVVNRLSLVPGTLVLDMDRDAGLLYVYAFDVRGARDFDRERRDAARSAAGVLRALGENENPPDGHRAGNEGGHR